MSKKCNIAKKRVRTGQHYRKATRDVRSGRQLSGRQHGRMSIHQVMIRNLHEFGNPCGLQVWVWVWVWVWVMLRVPVTCTQSATMLDIWHLEYMDELHHILIVGCGHTFMS